jgi:hypothetical protein
MTVEKQREKLHQRDARHSSINDELQRAAINEAPVTNVPPIVYEALRSPGQPLDAETRAFFEPRFGHDFSGVRVHIDARAAESAQAVNARAYTMGQDIVFDKQEFAPEIAQGRQLIAHELTHVTQQSQAHSPVLQCQTRSNVLDIPVAESGTVLEKIATKELRLDDVAAWTELSCYAQRTPWELPSEMLVAYFREQIEKNNLTFETITQDQRTVFRTLGDPFREELRILALKKSKLFRAINILHSKPGKVRDSAGNIQITATLNREDDISKERLKGTNTTSDIFEVNSLANQFTDIPYAGKHPVGIVAEVLLDQYNNYPLDPVANHVKQVVLHHGNLQSAQKQLERETHSLACGIVNLFVMAISRQPWIGDTFDTTQAKEWLKSSIFEIKPALIQVVNNQLRMTDTSGVLRKLAKGNRKPTETIHAPNEGIPLGQPNSKDKFEKTMKEETLKYGGADIRLALLTVSGQATHMHIAYLDLDGDWRTMDTYLALGDKPVGDLPYRLDYETLVKKFRLILDTPM